MRFGSLFSGIGGFDLGLERAGMECAWQCEIDDKCRGVLKRHWPEVQVYDDVRSIGRGVETVDLVCGGFPCQDLSVAGRRAGLAGERSGLWHEFARVLAEVRPEWCVIENVPGLLSSNKGRDFAVVLQGLVELGYRVAWRVLDAQYYGLAQRRKRVFVIGYLGDGRAAEVLFEREGVPRNPPSRRAAGQDATPILEACARTGSGGSGRNGGGIGDSGDPMFTLQSGHQHAVAKPLGSRTGGMRMDLDNDTYVTEAGVAACLNARDAKGPDSDTKPGHLIVAHALTSEGADASEDGTGRGTPLVFDSTQVTSRGNYSAPKAGDPCHPLAAGAHPPAVAFVQNTRDVLEGVRGVSTVRRLTPTECERLQGFPDSWTGGQADGPRYRQLGNAVAVPVAAWIGRRIMEVDR
jgi:DNA (cytosine-5)-methyltransferase 1